MHRRAPAPPTHPPRWHALPSLLLATTLLLLAKGSAWAQAPTPAPTTLQRSAETGDLRAVLRLADNYRDGTEGQPRNLALALQWYLKAAERDNVSAMTEAAYGHLQGWGGQRNETEAARWYRRAAEKGDGTGAYWLSEFHRQGWGGVEKNPAEMLRWLRAAARAGHAGAMRDLGVAHEQGLGMVADRAQALGWYQQAAAAGMDVTADLARLGVRPAVAAQGGGGGATAAPAPARKPDTLAGVYTCRVSGNVEQTNGMGERSPSFAEAVLKVTVAEDLSASFTFTRPPYRGSFQRSGSEYSWREDQTSSSGNERRRTYIEVQLRDKAASGGRSVRTFWRPVGSTRLSGSWNYEWDWEGRCRRTEE
jgi:hypothetical protein